MIDTKAKFGFLYNGYRIPQAYYWEIIIMYRKIFVIFIQVFLGQLGKIVQVTNYLLKIYNIGLDDASFLSDNYGDNRDKIAFC